MRRFKGQKGNGNIFHEMSQLPLRIGRRALWPFPTLYHPVGRLRKRLPPHFDYDLWIGGFPRSAGTFLWKWAELAFPTQRILGHLHIPPSILRMMQNGIPGLFVIRNPRDAVVSWSIFTGFSVDHCLRYYIDFHKVMWRVHEKLFVAPFESIIDEPLQIIERFGQQFHFCSQTPAINPSTRPAILHSIDEMAHSRHPAGHADPFRVSRPSPERTKRAVQLKKELEMTMQIRDRLAKAERLYQSFRDLAMSHDSAVAA
jgi:hypothetical protein